MDQSIQRIFSIVLKKEALQTSCPVSVSVEPQCGESLALLLGIIYGHWVSEQICFMWVRPSYIMYMIMQFKEVVVTTRAKLLWPVILISNKTFFYILWSRKVFEIMKILISGWPNRYSGWKRSTACSTACTSRTGHCMATSYGLKSGYFDAMPC